jgi:3-oxoacyl-[acyl-carrier protein] reductase
MIAASQMALPLAGQVALVTGASRGIGRAIAVALADCGADVAVNHYGDGAEAGTTLEQIRAVGRSCIAVEADVGQEKDVTRLFGALEQPFGSRLNILVNNAGVTAAQNIFETTVADWERIVNTNLTGCFLCSRAALRLMQPETGGRIVNIGSIAGQRGAVFGHVHYAASKSGIIGFTKTLARTAAPLGVRVNCVCPGLIDTDLLRRTHSPKELADLAATVPLGLGRTRDIGLVVAFLCGEGGNYITGATIDVNGGANFR